MPIRSGFITAVVVGFTIVVGPPDRLRQGYGGPPKLHAKAEGGHYVLALDGPPEGGHYGPQAGGQGAAAGGASSRRSSGLPAIRPLLRAGKRHTTSIAARATARTCGVSWADRICCDRRSSCSLDGHQYVLVAAGDTLYAFALY
jgi:hypothetical protein